MAETIARAAIKARVTTVPATTYAVLRPALKWRS